MTGKQLPSLFRISRNIQYVVLTNQDFREHFLYCRLLTLHFWQVTGQLLNTLLFILGGTLWGNVINPRRAAGWVRAQNINVIFSSYKQGWSPLISPKKSLD